VRKGVLAIVPARGGSKGFPGKNKALLQNSPLIAWSIAAGKEAAGVDRVVVSTDASDIADLGKAWGAEVPFLRPTDIAGDTATDVAFLQHALHYFEKNEGWLPEFVVLLRPTSPFRPKGLIDACLEKLIAHPSAESLRIITEAPQTPYKMWWQEESAFLQPILSAPEGIEQPFNAPRQALPTVYWQIGTLDIIRAETILDKHSASGTAILGHYLPQDFAIDIDQQKDLQAAELKATQLKGIVLPQK
jgi:CMP-N,N'-diacetyllegionaminic acid synthase